MPQVASMFSAKARLVVDRCCLVSALALYKVIAALRAARLRPSAEAAGGG